MDRDGDKYLAEESAADADEDECAGAIATAVPASTAAVVCRQPEMPPVAGAAADDEATNAADDNDVCPWEDE